MRGLLTQGYYLAQVVEIAKAESKVSGRPYVKITTHLDVGRPIYIGAYAYYGLAYTLLGLQDCTGEQVLNDIHLEAKAIDMDDLIPKAQVFVGRNCCVEVRHKLYEGRLYSAMSISTYKQMQRLIDKEILFLAK